MCTMSNFSSVGSSSQRIQNSARLFSGIPYTARSISLLGRLSPLAREPNSTSRFAPYRFASAASWLYSSSMLSPPSFLVRIVISGIASRFFCGVSFTGVIWGEIIPGGGFIHIVFFSSLIFWNLSEFSHSLNSYLFSICI